MWPEWISSRRHRRESPPPLLRSHSLSRAAVDFSCSSFKDIHTILKEKPDLEPNSPKSPSLFRRIRISTSALRALAASHTAPPPSPKLDPSPSPSPCLDQRIVVYYTSLRIVRRTFDDCRAVRSILRCFRAAIDERDVSIDDHFRDELHEILGRKNVTLPRVFIGGVYIGGVEEVKRMLDNGRLSRLIERLPKKSNQIGCDCCGGFRFVMCDECNGSHKVFTEKSGFRSCLSCNSNGLIRCPACFFVLPRHTKFIA